MFYVLCSDLFISILQILQEALEGYRQCSVIVNSNPEEVRKRAMADRSNSTHLSQSFKPISKAANFV